MLKCYDLSTFFSPLLFSNISLCIDCIESKTRRNFYWLYFLHRSISLNYYSFQLPDNSNSRQFKEGKKTVYEYDICVLHLIERVTILWFDFLFCKKKWKLIFVSIEGSNIYSNAIWVVQYELVQPRSNSKTSKLTKTKLIAFRFEWKINIEYLIKF